MANITPAAKSLRKNHTFTPSSLKTPSSVKERQKEARVAVCCFKDHPPTRKEQCTVRMQRVSSRLEKKMRIDFKSKPDLFMAGNEVRDSFGFAVAFYNKHTGETKYVPTRVFNVYRQHITDDTFEEQNNQTDNINYTQMARDQDSYVARKHKLALNFGSARSAKMALQAASRVLEKDTVNSLVDNTLEKIKYKKDDGEKSGAVSTIVSTILPIANEEAKEPHNIYEWSQVIPEHIFDVASSDIDNFLTMEPEFMVKEYGFARNIIQTVPLIQKSDVERDIKKKFMTNVIYAASCAKLIGETNRKRTKLSLTSKEMIEIYKIPSNIGLAIFKQFFGEPTAVFRTGEKKYDFNRDVRSRLQAYTLTMALLLNPARKILINEWARILCMTDSTITTILRSLGCEVDMNTRSPVRHAVLKQTPMKAKQTQVTKTRKYQSKKR